MNARSKLTFLLLHALLAYLPQDGVHAQGSQYRRLNMDRLPHLPTANVSTTWTNSPTSPHTIAYINGNCSINPILLRTVPSSSDLAFAFGFYCRGDCKHYLLSIYIIYIGRSEGLFDIPQPQVIWYANRNRPVKPNSILQLTRDGGLLLKDSDGSLAWSTNTTGCKSTVVGLNLSENGNLLLHDANAAVVWQSFDHPSDSLLYGQSIVEGQRLTANVSPLDLTPGELYISHTSLGFQAFVGSDPPLAYYNFEWNQTITDSGSPYTWLISVTPKALTFLVNSSSSSDPNVTLENPPVSGAQFLRLESKGRLKVHEWKGIERGWSSNDDAIPLIDCALPMMCGRYGICSMGSYCRCPKELSSTAHPFTYVNSRRPDLGCSATSPLSCKSHQQHRLLRLERVMSFKHNSFDGNNITEEGCKEACLRNCTCKAAIYRYYRGEDFEHDAPWTSCLLMNEVFSLWNDWDSDSEHITYIKVQETPQLSSSKVSMILGVTTGVVVAVLLAISIFVYRKRRAKVEEEEEDDDEEMESFLPLNCMPTRFSYEDLRSSTDNFASDKKLGSGGFGSVFEGKLVDGTRIAVKKLQSVRQGKREFVAEVQTIGNIHHLNLVRLIGFCVHRSYKLLVYEYMTNGSLDKWIFPKSDGCKLSWEIRRNIICDVAKGLLYLHEECRQKIAHLDIKPQNILLDSNFNAKVADFGLAKLIDRDQSAVKTVIRGTPGYMAPEWLLSVKISETADIYSFGIVILETVCTRKNLDYSQPEESVHLLPLFKEKAMSGQLLDLLDERERNVQKDAVEMVEMLKLAIWCLQNDTGKRPSISMVLKVLEGTMEIPEEDLSNGLMAPTQRTHQELQVFPKSSRLLESILSGPR